MFCVLILVTVFTLTASENCTTPNGQDGNCIPVNNCPSIYKLFNTDISPSMRKYLLDSKCSSLDEYPKVCCPIGSNLPPTNITTRIRIDEQCGLSLVSKIFGGTKTKIDEFPWLALLQYESPKGKTYFGCGGTLINHRFVLTARHCLHRNLKTIRLGEWRISTNPDCMSESDCAPPVRKVGIEKTIPYRDKTSVQNDIALIKLDQDVAYNDFIKPICLPTSDDLISKTYTNENLTVAGWGLTEEEKPSDVKLKVSVPVKPLSDCETGLKKAYNVEIALHNAQICAGGVGGKDSCNGDSGGPLMHLKDTETAPQWYIVGITSYGPNNPCGAVNRPGVYVNVAKYINWINTNIES